MEQLDKKELRRSISARKRAMSQAQIEAASEALARQLFAHPLYRQAKALYGYLSYNQEVRTEAILRRAQADGKLVAVPKVVGQEMVFYELDWSRVETGYCGIPEPSGGRVVDEPEALVLMPGLAFDPRGNRMGYGGGFYDRFLAAQPHPTLALCYDFQLLPHLDAQAHDIPVDAVLWAPVD